MGVRGKPSFDKALAYLESVLSHGSGDGDTPLPSVRSLATAAGVSLVTMSKAVGRLCATGKLERVTGIGIFPPSPAAVRRRHARRSPVSTTWRRVAERLHQDLITAALPSGRISLKELRTRYRVNHRTLRRAWDHLCAEHGDPRLAVGGSRVHAACPHAGRSCIHLVAWGQTHGTISFSNPWGQDHLRQLEQACAREGVELRILTYNASRPVPWFVDRTGAIHERVPDIDRTLGFVVWTIGYAVTVEQVLRHLRTYDRPMAVLDEEARIDLLSPLGGRPDARVFRYSAAATPPRAMACHLIGLGHRRVAYISPFHGSDWSRLRGRELAAGFAAGGVGDAVTFLTLDQAFGPGEYYSDARLASAITRLLTRGLRESLGDPALPYDPFVAAYAQDAQDVMQGEVVRQRLLPLFEQALADERLTAWVCDNDRTALMALGYLRGRGVAVPGRVSVCGFDDEPAAIVHNLTSYNYNVQGVVHAMLTHVLRPRFTPRSRPVIEVEGMVMERGSTGRAPAPGQKPCSPR